MRYLFAALAFAGVALRQRLGAGREAHLHHCQQFRRLRRRPLPGDRRDLRRRGRDRLLPVARLLQAASFRKVDRDEITGACRDQRAPAARRRIRRHRVPALAAPNRRGFARRPPLRRPRIVRPIVSHRHLRQLARSGANRTGSHVPGARSMMNSGPIRDGTAPAASGVIRGAAAAARRFPAPPAQRAVQPGVAGAHPGLRTIRYWNTGMAGAGHPGRERRDDRQGGRRPAPTCTRPRSRARWRSSSSASSSPAGPTAPTCAKSSCR